MFRRNNPVNMRPEGAHDNNAQSSNAPAMNELPLRPASAPVGAYNAPQQAQAPQAGLPPARPLGNAPQNQPNAPQAAKGELPASRFGGIPGVLPRRVNQPTDAPAMDQSGLRKLIVGREITLSGDITACDILVVEGNIEATLRDGKHLEITEDGHFKGLVEIEDADISGKFEGTLTVRGRLKVRSTGQIEGNLSYGEIEVEAGGKLIGEVKVLASSQKKTSEAKADSQKVLADA